jgi:DNA replication protein DnaC
MAKINDWQKCVGCPDEYRPKQLDKHGRCYLCAKHQHELKGKLIEGLGGAKPYKTFTLDKFVDSPGVHRAFEAIKRFDPKRDNLYLSGVCGVGKTFLGCLAARRAIEANKRAIVLKSCDILRRTRGRSSVEEEREIRHIVGYPLLVLDDLGVEKVSEYTLQIIYEIVDRRDMQDRQGLIVTSNLSLEALAEKLGDDRLPSRLSGLCTFIEMTGRDRRPDERRAKAKASEKDAA